MGITAISPFRAGLRGMRLALHIFCGVVLAGVFPLLQHETRRGIVKHWSRKLLDVLHVGFEVRGSPLPEGDGGRLLVANHISWLDVIAMNAAAPACFLAKSEVRNWPLLGWLCSRAGTLFIRRDVRRDTVRANREISGMLGQGGDVALFPEGTSGDELLPGHFHSSLLQGAIDSEACLCPVAIRYHDADGRVCADAAFVGDMSFVESLWKILCSPSLHVRLIYLPGIACAGKSRRLLAAEAHGAIHLALAAYSPNHSVCVPDASTPYLLGNAVPSVVS